MATQKLFDSTPFVKPNLGHVGELNWNNQPLSLFLVIFQ
jgi:hypothetical protein